MLMGMKNMQNIDALSFLNIFINDEVRKFPQRCFPVWILFDRKTSGVHGDYPNKLVNKINKSNTQTVR